MPVSPARSGVVLLVGLLLLPAPGGAQDVPAPGAAQREEALALSERGRHVEALPLLEELSTTLAEDTLVWERYGIALYSVASTLPDPAAAQQMRVRAKEALNRSRELGNRSALAALADTIPADGSMPALSPNSEAQAAMQQGEAAFGRGDFMDAVTHYQTALGIEPTNYSATLFIGDCYYRMNNLEIAAEWFARAVALNPDIETAYRYWGDALMRAGRTEDARGKFVDALIAEPYSQGARAGIAQWAKMTGARLGRPAITPFSGLPRSPDGRVTIDLTATPADPMAAAWIVYATTKAQWNKEEFLKRFPDAPAYRPSLAEEVDAYERLLAFADEQAAKGQPIADPQIATIRGLRDRGMLEPFILLHAPSQGIAQDFPQYRAQHRDRLQAYVEAMIEMPK